MGAKIWPLRLLRDLVFNGKLNGSIMKIIYDK